MSRLTYLALALVLFTACDPISGVEEIVVVEWQGTLEGEPGWEHLSGLGAFVWQEGTTLILAGAELEGDEPGAVRPWHVHHNTCAAGGGIVGADEHYPRLVIGADGSAFETTNVSAAIDPTANYHVNVHLSEEEMGVIIACGDLEIVGGT